MHSWGVHTNGWKKNKLMIICYVSFKLWIWYKQTSERFKYSFIVNLKTCLTTLTSIIISSPPFKEAILTFRLFDWFQANITDRSGRVVPIFYSHLFYTSFNSLQTTTNSQAISKRNALLYWKQNIDLNTAYKVFYSTDGFPPDKS